MASKASENAAAVTRATERRGDNTTNQRCTVLRVCNQPIQKSRRRVLPQSQAILYRHLSNTTMMSGFVTLVSDGSTGCLCHQPTPSQNRTLFFSRKYSTPRRDRSTAHLPYEVYLQQHQPRNHTLTAFNTRLVQFGRQEKKREKKTYKKRQEKFKKKKNRKKNSNANHTAPSTIMRCPSLLKLQRDVTGAAFYLCVHEEATVAFRKPLAEITRPKTRRSHEIGHSLSHYQLLRRKV